MKQMTVVFDVKDEITEEDMLRALNRAIGNSPYIGIYPSHCNDGRGVSTVNCKCCNKVERERNEELDSNSTL